MPYNFQTTITRESVACPGVRFRVRVLTEGMRRQLRRELAASHARQSEIAAERADFVEQTAKRLGKAADAVMLADLGRVEQVRYTQFNAQLDVIADTEERPAYFRAAFVSVDGLTIDGAQPENVLDNAPPALVKEITDLILAEAILSPEARANLESPTTSNAAERQATSATTAQSASAEVGTPPATVNAGSLTGNE